MSYQYRRSAIARLCTGRCCNSLKRWDFPWKTEKNLHVFFRGLLSPLVYWYTGFVSVVRPVIQQNTASHLMRSQWRYESCCGDVTDSSRHNQCGDHKTSLRPRLYSVADRESWRPDRQAVIPVILLWSLKPGVHVQLVYFIYFTSIYFIQTLLQPRKYHPGLSLPCACTSPAPSSSAAVSRSEGL